MNANTSIEIGPRCSAHRVVPTLPSTCINIDLLVFCRLQDVTVKRLLGARMARNARQLRMTDCNARAFQPVKKRKGLCRSLSGRHFLTQSTNEGERNRSIGTLSRMFCSTVAVTACWFAFATAVRADTIKVIVPFAAGSIVDVVPRIVFAEIAARSNHVFVIENKPGAGSIIGSAVVAGANPDGETVLATSSSLVIAPILHPAGMATERRLSAVTSLGVISDVLVANPTIGAKTVHQFVAWAKSRRATFASLGVGSAIYMNAERFAKSADISVTNVSFTGAQQALSEVVAGRVDFCFCAIGTAIPYIRSGKLTALAVSTRRRSMLLPDVPTTLEAGYKDSDYAPWLGSSCLRERLEGRSKRSTKAFKERSRSLNYRRSFGALASNQRQCHPGNSMPS